VRLDVSFRCAVCAALHEGAAQITGNGELFQSTTHADDTAYSSWTSWDGIAFAVHQDTPIELTNGWEASSKIDANRDTRDPVISRIRSEKANRTVCSARCIRMLSARATRARSYPVWRPCSGKLENKNVAASPLGSVPQCVPESGSVVLLGNRNGVSTRVLRAAAVASSELTETLRTVRRSLSL
jgi:hypothetical protein